MAVYRGFDVARVRDGAWRVAGYVRHDGTRLEDASVVEPGLTAALDLVDELCRRLDSQDVVPAKSSGHKICFVKVTD